MAVHRKWWMIGTWAVLLAVASVGATSLQNSLKVGGFSQPGTEFNTASNVLARDLGRLLRLIESPLANGALVGIPRGFGRMSVAERERLLRRLSTGPVPQLRSGFQGLKRMAAFMGYAIPNGQGTNPRWREIGYPGPPRASAQTEGLLRITPVDGPLRLEADVCIIGSGAGGSVMAAELSAAGMRVVVLEAGSGKQAPDFDQLELPAVRDLYLDHGQTTNSDLSISIIAGSSLGGGTTVNWQTSLRTPDRIRQEWSERSGVRLFTEASFDHSLDSVLARTGVNTDESVVNANNAVIVRGAEALGYRYGTIPRNAKSCDAGQCGFCVYGCRRGGKQGGAITFLHDAQSEGRDMTILANCRAQRLVLENGHVRSVTAMTTGAENGIRHEVDVRARTFVVAGGAIETPPLLLRSGLDQPAIGGSLFLHPTTWLIGLYAEQVATWDGPPHTIYCDEFTTLNDNFGFMLEAVPAHPGSMALALPWFSGRQHHGLMRQSARMAAFIPLVRDRDGGRVGVTRTGRPRISYRLKGMDARHLQRGITEGIRLHMAAGAESVVTLHTRHQGLLRRTRDTTQATIDAFAERAGTWPVHGNRCMLFSAHQMGSCPMGVDARRSACDPEGRVHGVRNLYVADASLFPAASGVNPMITVMALAHHVAQGIIAAG